MNRKTIHAPVEGMTCASCVQTVEKALNSAPGVQEAVVNLATKTATVHYSPAETNIEALQAAVSKSGYTLLSPVVDAISAIRQEIEHPEELAHAHGQNLRKDLLFSGLLAVPVFILGMFFMDQSWAAWLSMLLSAPVVFWFGRRFFQSGLKHLRNLNTNMDTLVALSTGTAWFYSAFNTFFPHYFHQQGGQHQVYFEGAAVIVFFILLGKWLEEKAGKRTRLALVSLFKLQPKKAIINRFGQEIEATINDIHPGDELVIKPGMNVPVDGIVLSGESSVDESLLTGESKAVHKSAKSAVFAGMINQDGHFHMVAHKVGKETYLSQLINAVVAAQGSKAPIQRLADRIAGVFVPVVIVIAVLTFVFWLASGRPDAVHMAISSAISVLIIACPCALGLATPTAIMVGIGVGAKHGILIRNAESLETAARLRAVVVDKTGTVTVGHPTVTRIKWMQPDYEALHGPALYAIEKKSEHPLAVAIASYFSTKEYPNAPVSEFSAIRGRGIKAAVNGHSYNIGSSAFMQDLGIKRPATVFHSPTETVSYFASGNTLLGEIHIEDAIKEGSKEAVEGLRALGVTVYLATGDLNSAAETVAQEVGIKAIRAQMLPHQKRAYVEEIQARGYKTAMVGDGVNDAEAMAIADVSIAMAKGSDIAINVADITLATNDLRGVPRAIGLSKRTLKIIKQNLFWAFAYNAAAIPIATGFLFPYTGLQLNPMIAGAAMAFSSVTVVLNSLKLNKHSFKTNSFDLMKPVN